MSGSTWFCTWESGVTADNAAGTVTALGGQGAIVLCGAVRAPWSVLTFNKTEKGFHATLVPVDVHAIPPHYKLYELPMPDEAH